MRVDVADVSTSHDRFAARQYMIAFLVDGIEVLRSPITESMVTDQDTLRRWTRGLVAVARRVMS